MRMPGIAREPLPDHLEAARAYVMSLPIEERRAPQTQRLQSPNVPFVPAPTVAEVVQRKSAFSVAREGAAMTATNQQQRAASGGGREGA